ncbi:MAG: hypothetical protein HS111_07080 [Kofleriaceae bacterium]|nr:hypothetical protein [Kofleriaceae bacterium]MCL4225624.1 hypothetical protein [Myxococcales bacterium]
MWNTAVRLAVTLAASCTALSCASSSTSPPSSSQLCAEAFDRRIALELALLGDANARRAHQRLLEAHRAESLALCEARADLARARCEADAPNLPALIGCRAPSVEPLALTGARAEVQP